MNAKDRVDVPSTGVRSWQTDGTADELERRKGVIAR